ncbi:dihydroorotate dehydrogenase-like protein [Desulfopila inferna]|uniref:dihydroorotate dehydrogenase-like protein n=1 Tax=Desulfopila inferna TaxID=468528 RepID=UPI00196255B2|nr:dihydroorotate dehydrogenase-like protein [Desulfopila inferna]MBM9606352.1 dihydroorotate dehydrogenase-like protein [Desulfopila inferna]
MKDLSTNYLGLRLKNPLIVGSCGLTGSVDKISELADNNAGAIVLKSLFEEQILAELHQNIESYNTDYPEAFDYVKGYTRDNAVSAYLDLLSGAKQKTQIPIIASINCVSDSEWVSFAKSVENAGADALEINISLLPSQSHKRSVEYEKVYFDVLEKVAALISIPIALKMSRYSSSLANLVARLSWTGKVAGFVLFNRYYRPDFDIENLTVRSAPVFSTPEELATPLRWIALLSNRVGQDFAASTGVHDSAGLIKQLLAGAKAVQVVSSIYTNGAPHITEILKGLEEWMDRKTFNTINDFRGMLSYQDDNDSSGLQRIQFMKNFAGIE